jgi:hypothetical protein
MRIVAMPALLGEKAAIYGREEHYLGRTDGVSLSRNSLMNKPLALISRT